MNDLKFISAFGETLEISFHKDFNRKKKEIQQTISGLMEVFLCSQNENHSMISIKSTFLVYRSTTILLRKYYYGSQFFL